MPDPSLTYCKEKGYSYEFRILGEPTADVETEIPSIEGAGNSEAPPPPRESDSGITYGVCIFSDGTECEVWSFFRGECLPGQMEYAEDGLPVVNIVNVAGLEKTITLEILKLDQGLSREPYIHLLTIDDETQLNQIIAALDAPIWTYSGMDCVTPYQLQFHLVDGSVQTFNYHARWDRMTTFDFGEVCHPNQESILRGDQEFLAGKGGSPPGAFDALIKQQIASTWEATINVAERLELDRAAEIEILETVLIEGVGVVGEHTLDIEVVTRLKTNDPQAIQQLIGTLDKEFEFVPRAGIRTMFKLRFSLDNGKVQVISYGSEGEQPTVLRGDPDIWQGRDILAGDEFPALIEKMLASNL